MVLDLFNILVLKCRQGVKSIIQLGHKSHPILWYNDGGLTLVAIVTWSVKIIHFYLEWIYWDGTL